MAYTTSDCCFVPDCSGTILLSGNITDTLVKKIDSTGGIVLSGYCHVETSYELYPSYVAVLPLDENGDGTTNEYVDRADSLDGTGGDGISGVTTVPLKTDGVYCLPAQQFYDGRQVIRMDADPLPDMLTVSFWASIEATGTRLWFTRGSLIIGYSGLRRPFAELIDGAGHYRATSPLALEFETFYHVAVTWDKMYLRLYIDGTLEATKYCPTPAFTGSPIRLGCDYTGLGMTGRLQEVRIAADVKSATWIKTEALSFCQGLYTISPEYS